MIAEENSIGNRNTDRAVWFDLYFFNFWQVSELREKALTDTRGEYETIRKRLQHVLLFEQGGAGIHEKTYYAIKNGKIVDAAHNSYDYNVNKHYYERQLNKEKPVTLEPNIGIAGKGLRKNTAANRKRYLK